MIRKHWKLLLFLLIVVIIGVFYLTNNSREMPASQESIDPRLVMEAKVGNIRDTIIAEGFIEPVNEEDLAFPASSGSVKIENIYVKEGDRVEEGELLMELDKTEAQLNYLQRENAYNRARIGGTKNEIEEARLQLELTRDRLNNLELRAPFAGIITDIYLEKGNYYSSGAALTIKDVSRLQIEVTIEEAKIPVIKIGLPVEVTLPSLPGVSLSGEVSKLGDEANNEGAVVTLPLTVLLDELDYEVKLGVSAELDIIIDEVKGRVVVPVTAVFSEEGQDKVIRIVKGEQEKVLVETGLND
ncbi:MAG TPA: efflux RND transporter periplasmic adaptor subunit, partial [Halanaerobiales bacterium]|nr:efflux RND transporter periplasmic adaptor subunit [Halanaerobiales bacterium]